MLIYIIHFKRTLSMYGIYNNFPKVITDHLQAGVLFCQQFQLRE
jgi:hypothetical protein